MYYLKFVLQFAISMGLQWGLIGLFRKKRLFHSIYELGPDTHQGKSQTPTLGGLGILVAFLVGFGLFFDVFMGNQALVWVVLVMVLFAFIGLYDDGVSLFRSKNQGLWLWHKLVLQVLISIGLIVGFSVFIRDLSWWEMGGYVFVMVGASNATNLTDGLDGLLAGCSFITLVGFTWLFQELGLVSEQLFCVLLMIGIFGFYVFNRHPARIFMGDTGSLSLGAGFAALAMIIGDVWVLLPFGAVYILGGLKIM